MRIITHSRLRLYEEKHAEAKDPLDSWYRIAKHADWRNLAETRRDFSHADLVGTCTVFNIKGKGYRLITKIHYQSRRVYIRAVLSHAEYSKGGWKNDCGI